MDHKGSISIADFEKRFAGQLGKEDFTKAVSFFTWFHDWFTLNHCCFLIHLIDFSLSINALPETLLELKEYEHAFGRQRTLDPDEVGSEEDPSIIRLLEMIENLKQMAEQQKNELSRRRILAAAE